MLNPQIDFNCPNCSAKLKISAKTKEFKCQKCGIKIIIDNKELNDGLKRIQNGISKLSKNIKINI